MLLLAIDTSAAVTAAVHDGAAVLAADLVHDPRHHAELLVPMVERVLAARRRRPVAAHRRRRRTRPRPVHRPARRAGDRPHARSRAGRPRARRRQPRRARPAGGRRRPGRRRRDLRRGHRRPPQGGLLGAATSGATAPRSRSTGRRSTVRPRSRSTPCGCTAAARCCTPTSSACRPTARSTPRPARSPAVAARRLAAGDDLGSTAPLYLRRPDAVPSGGAKSVLPR